MTHAQENESLLHVLGPGFVTGASDDDPSGIGTYSQVGARFGFQMLWVMLFSYPLMSAIQEIAAKIGRTTGRGIAGNLRKHYPAYFNYPLIGAIFIATVVNIGVDLGAMGASLKLIVGGPALIYDLLFASICFIGALGLSYKKYSNFLKWLSLILFAYVVTAFVVHVPWSEALRSTFVPSISLKTGFLSAFVAVLGTTISPYLFFWQASQEVEQAQTKRQKPIKHEPKAVRPELKRIRLDTLVGMFFSNLIAWFIIVAAAVTLHASGQTNIESAEQAASALKPLGGSFAFLLFAVGIIGTGLLAVPVLAGAAAYAVGEELRERVGLENAPKRAPVFYFVFGLATAVGVSINFLPVNPIKALYFSAIVNGVASVPIMVAMMLMVRSPKIMGEVSKRGTANYYIAWIATLTLGLAVIAMFFTM